MKSVQESKILPGGTIFEDPPVPMNDQRKMWAEEAFRKMKECDVVFFDPDNGLQVKSVRPHSNRGGKYVALDELSPYLQRGQSLIVYQHLAHHVFAEVQIEEHLKKVRKMEGCRSAFALRYHRGTARAFLVMEADEHHKLRERARPLSERPWSQHFTLHA